MAQYKDWLKVGALPVTDQTFAKLIFFAAAAFGLAGYFRLVPVLSIVSEAPLPLIAGGVLTACLIYVLTKIEP